MIGNAKDKTRNTEPPPRQLAPWVLALCGLLLLLMAPPVWAAPDSGVTAAPDAQPAAAPAARPAPAKQPPAKGGFQPWSPPEKEQVSAPLFVVLAYSAIWLAVLAFVLSVWLRQRRLEQELAQLIREQKKSG